nr:DUF4347 domain-containing protein [Gammaproteobacteria bacterium]
MLKKFIRQAISGDGRGSGPGTPKTLFEPMEPKILLSADALSGLLPSLPDVDDDAVGLGLQDSIDLLQASNLDSINQQSSEQSPDLDDLALALAPVDDSTPRLEIVFLDAGVENGEQLLEDLIAAEDHAITQVHILDTGSDGIDQITQILAGQEQDVDAIHIISHGAAGQIQLGSTTLATGSLDGYAGQLKDWGGALADNGDILIYGCDLAADEQGRALVDAISVMTDADVAASDDQTGHAASGGDWDLEYRVGLVDAAMFGPGISQTWDGILSTYLDQFNTTASYAGDDGVLSWTDVWQEVGETNGAGSGNARVFDGFTGDGGGNVEIRIKGNTGIWREADLSGATSATLTFDYSRDSIEADDHLVVYVQDAAGVTVSGAPGNWVELARYSGAANDATYLNATPIDLSPYMAADTRILFFAEGASQGNDNLWVDNLQIEITTSTNVAPTLS